MPFLLQNPINEGRLLKAFLQRERLKWKTIVKKSCGVTDEEELRIVFWVGTLQSSVCDGEQKQPVNLKGCVCLKLPKSWRAKGPFKT